MYTADIEYTYEGLRLVGALALDDTVSGPRPAVLLCHGGTGLGGQVRHWTRRVAGLGCVAFALDCYGRGRELPPADLGPRFAELSADPARARAIGRAGLDVLRSHEAADPARVAAVGFCMGGTLALDLARDGEDLKAVVAFHADLATPRPEDAGNITGRVLVCVGTEDPFVPLEQRLAFEREMCAAGVDWRMILHGGVAHGFTNPAFDGTRPGIRYDGRAAERSWRAMVDLFGEELGTRITSCQPGVQHGEETRRGRAEDGRGE